MKKEEALAVLHEISDACKENVTMSCVSLDPTSALLLKALQGYQIKLKCDLDTQSRDLIVSICAKHTLALTEKNGYVILKPI